MNRIVWGFLLGAFVGLLSGCGFPTDAEAERAFLERAEAEVPDEISLKVISTFRGDGDSQSFSQIVVFEAVAQTDIVVQEGWLSGVEFRKAVPKREGRVELIYRRGADDRWVVVDDGLTAPPA